MAREYCEGMRCAQVNGDFVDMAITVNNYMLCDNRIAATLLQAEEHLGAATPFDSTTMLYHCCQGSEGRAHRVGDGVHP